MTEKTEAKLEKSSTNSLNLKEINESVRNFQAAINALAAKAELFLKQINEVAVKAIPYIE